MQSKTFYRGDVVVTTTTKLSSTNPKLKFCSCSNPARGELKTSDGENFQQLSWMKIMFNTLHQSNILQKQFKSHNCSVGGNTFWFTTPFSVIILSVIKFCTIKIWLFICCKTKLKKKILFWKNMWLLQYIS